jgi:hypothetical protein
MPTFEQKFKAARKFMTTLEIIQTCGTVSPSKRISELRKKKRLDERPSMRYPGLKEYRYSKEA